MPNAASIRTSDAAGPARQPSGHAKATGVPTAERLAARAAHLRYVSPDQPGYRREAVPGGFRYRDPAGRLIRAKAELERLRKLAIPPAYTDVWICPNPDGHLQAVGRDARGRRQYRYHARWRAVRDEAKFGKMLLFGEKLPLIRQRVEHDLRLRDLPRGKVCAAVVRLLETSLARIGNEEYARANKSFGLTTLRGRHAKVRGSRVVFDFRAKHGINRHIELDDRRLATIVGKLQDLSGQHLFQYVDEADASHDVTSDDVNAYLHEITGEEITAKDFRTWAATNLAALALGELERFDTAARAKHNLLRAIEAVAKLLGNTPSVCRKCYIHPAIFEGYLDGSLLDGLKARADAALARELPATRGLTAEEAAVTAFLSRKLGETMEAG